MSADQLGVALLPVLFGYFVFGFFRHVLENIFCRFLTDYMKQDKQQLVEILNNMAVLKKMFFFSTKFHFLVDFFSQISLFGDFFVKLFFGEIVFFLAKFHFLVIFL